MARKRSVVAEGTVVVTEHVSRLLEDNPLGDPHVRKLTVFYLDCGYRDQFLIHYGSRLLSQRLRQARIEHRYEEFDDDHTDIDYRMDISSPLLAKALA